MTDTNMQILLKSRPRGEPTPDNFELVQTPIPQLAQPGQVLCRTVYLSLDPYMRGRMNAGRSYADPVKVGQVMCGGTVSQVVQSNDPRFTPGDYALGESGWQGYAVAPADSLTKLDPAAGPLSYYLGVLGMPGMTAYFGLLDIGRPKAGETLVVSAAAGAVGSAVGQIGKLKGCRVVGVAGSDAKCELVVKEFGFDAAVNYKSEDFVMGLRRAAPDGIDIYFDNVAGLVLDAALKMINLNGRIPLIGLISVYNATMPPAWPNLMPLLIKRALIRGMIVSDYKGRAGEFVADMAAWVRSGQVKCRETVVDGLASAPSAFMGLFHGENTGKLVVRVAAEE